MENFDYSQWQRKTKDPALRRVTTPNLPRDGNQRIGQSGFGTFSVGSDTLSRVGSACSLSKCSHPWNNFRAMEAKKEAREKKRARMKEIKVKIRMHEKIFQETKQREAELMRENLEIFHLIESAESRALGKVDQSLRQYEKSWDGIRVMKLRFQRQKKELEMELAATRQQLDGSLSQLRSQVNRASKQVTEIYEELALLNNYKDKVYPERLVLIHQLKQKIASTQLNNEEEEAELLHIIQAEHRKLLNSDDSAMRQMRQQVAQSALEELHPSVTKMSHENQKLEADIQFHQQLNAKLSKEIQQLEASIEQLQEDPDSSIPRSMFPSLFQQYEKCSPDMDVVLDIPTRKFPVI